jgi:hypothetical protein
MKISTIEQFLTREDVFTWITDGELDLPDNLADEFVDRAIRETGFAFLLDALHTQGYCESFAVDLIDSLHTSNLFIIASFQDQTRTALRDYARYVCDCNLDIALAALKKFQGRYAKDAQIINLWETKGALV